MKKNTKIATAIAMGVGIAAAGGVGFGFNELTHQPEVQVVPGPVVNATQGQLEVAFQNGVDSVEPIVEEVVINNTVEVPTVDTEMQQKLCDRLMYEDMDECVREVESESDALELAVAEIEAEFADFLDDEGVVSDEDDVSLVTVYDDFEDIEVLKSDYDRDRYKFEIEAKINDDDDRKVVTFTVEVEDGVAELIDVEE